MDWKQALFYTATIVQAGLCVRLFVSGLHRKYRAFFVYILAMTLESVVLSVEMWLMRSGVLGRSLYPNTWLVTRTLIPVLEVRVAAEIFRLWASAHRGIGRFGSGLLRLIVTLAIVAVAVTAPIDLARGEWGIEYQIVTILNRGVHGGVVVFLLSTVVFFFVCGGPVSPNLRRHSVTMLVFSTANAAGYFAAARNSIAFCSVLLPIVSILTQMAWMTFLTPGGEAVRPWARLSSDEAEAVTEWNRRIEEFAERIRASWRTLQRQIAG